MKRIQYIENNENLGILYDWNFIRKEYKKLKCPNIFYNPCKIPFEHCKYFVGISQRSVGKTTNFLLLGLIMHEYYGTQIQYLRQNEDQIAPMRTSTLFDAIIENGYIQKITKGRWNFIHYEKRKWYYCNLDDNGYITEQSSDYVCSMLSVYDHAKYKSGYNAVKGDLIIFDEFIGDFYYQDEFVDFCDLVKTIIRDRQSPVICMIANNTDKESQYFSEMEIYDEIRQLQAGQSTEVTTVQGTQIYIEYITVNAEKQKMLDKLNNLFFGFNNKRLGSITGKDWAIKPKQRIPDDKYTYVINNLFIYHNNRYIRLDIVDNEKLGLCMYVHYATRVYDDSIILTVSDRTDNRYFNALGTRKIRNLIRDMYDSNRIYYASNDCASFFENYYRNCTKMY